MIPKIEEVDDNEPLSVGIAGEEERLMDVDPLSPSPSEGLPNSEVTSPVEPNPNEPPPLKRKRGRPRKHPLPTPGQSKAAAKGRSKTGCATCRRRKKKCDETKPACLNCQKNAVVCEGYPVREVWKSGKQKIEEEGKLFFFFFLNFVLVLFMCVNVCSWAKPPFSQRQLAAALSRLFPVVFPS